MIEITSAKGFAFEEIVHEHVALIAAVHGDIAEDWFELGGWAPS